jgi:hypothetical protein
MSAILSIRFQHDRCRPPATREANIFIAAPADRLTLHPFQRMAETMRILLVEDHLELSHWLAKALRDAAARAARLPS